MAHSASMFGHLDEAAAQARRVAATRSADMGGVFRRRDLVEWGIDDSLLQAMFRRGDWVRLRHGVYADSAAAHSDDPVVRHRLDLAAAIAAAQEPTFAVGPSAALLHGLPLPYVVPDAVHLVRDTRQDLRSLQRVSRHPLTIPSMHLTSHSGVGANSIRVDGIATVSAAVAAITTAPHVGFTRKVGLFDAVLWNAQLTVDDIRAVLDDWPRLRDRAKSVAALELARAGAQTYLETVSRLQLTRVGLPEPLLQVPFYDDAGLIGLVDMYWQGFGVVGEADGAVKYTSRDDLIREKRREDRLRALGLSVVRWMWDEITTTPDAVATRIRSAARRVA